MFIPNADCIVRKAGSTNVYGEATLGAPIAERCGIVRLHEKVSHTTVRADSSASRGHADEGDANVVVLLAVTTKAGLGDQLEVMGLKVRINDKQPRVSVTGKLDHYEVRGEFWE
jgi:hypothetical protein